MKSLAPSSHPVRLVEHRRDHMATTEEPTTNDKWMNLLVHVQQVFHMIDPDASEDITRDLRNLHLRGPERAPTSYWICDGDELFWASIEMNWGWYHARLVMHHAIDNVQTITGRRKVSLDEASAVLLDWTRKVLHDFVP